jgi:Mg-chelatase subunit ChlD
VKLRTFLRSGVLAFILPIMPFVADKALATECLDVALVLAVDASASVSLREFTLQQKGIAQAFRDPAVLDAISMAGRVAVGVIFWGSEGLQKPQSGWVIVENPAGAERFARKVESMPRLVTGDTGLGAGLMAALEKFASLEDCALRRVVNVSGDGEETRVFRRKRASLAPTQVRSIAESQNVEINALAISNEEAGLAEYYASNVITGPDAFVMQVSNYEDFSYALRRKLIREISPRAVSERPGANGRNFRLN